MAHSCLATTSQLYDNILTKILWMYPTFYTRGFTSQPMQEYNEAALTSADTLTSWLRRRDARVRHQLEGLRLASICLLRLKHPGSSEC